jgi:hypothetical protein
MSLQLLEAAVEEAGMDLDTDRIRRIQDMICGTDAGSPSPAGAAFTAAAGADDGMGDGCHGATYSTGPWLPHKQWMRQVRGWQGGDSPDAGCWEQSKTP